MISLGKPLNNAALERDKLQNLEIQKSTEIKSICNEAYAECSDLSASVESSLDLAHVLKDIYKDNPYITVTYGV